MNNSFYGIKTQAKDGRWYKSKFEAEFVNKFLLPSGLEYQYEVRYDKDTKRTCDFCITKYGIWIECAYNTYQSKPRYQNYKRNARINFVRATYNDRHHLLAAGCTWDPVQKVWFMLYNRTDLSHLHAYMSLSDLEKDLISDGNLIREDYNEILREKLGSRDGDIIIVTAKDVEDYKDLIHLLVGKMNALVYWRIIDVALTQDKQESLAKSQLLNPWAHRSDDRKVVVAGRGDEEAKEVKDETAKDEPINNKQKDEDDLWIAGAKNIIKKSHPEVDLDAAFTSFVRQWPTPNLVATKPSKKLENWCAKFKIKRGLAGHIKFHAKQMLKMQNSIIVANNDMEANQ